MKCTRETPKKNRGEEVEKPTSLINGPQKRKRSENFCHRFVFVWNFCAVAILRNESRHTQKWERRTHCGENNVIGTCFSFTSMPKCKNARKCECVFRFEKIHVIALPLPRSPNTQQLSITVFALRTTQLKPAGQIHFEITHECSWKSCEGQPKNHSGIDGKNDRALSCQRSKKEIVVEATRLILNIKYPK